MDEKCLKVKTSHGRKREVKPTSDLPMGDESSITKSKPEMLLKHNLELMEEILTKGNLKLAYEAVRENKGSSGIDGMNVEELKEYLKDKWFEIKGQLLSGSYRPKPVRRVEIPKAGGGKRKLGIPTVLDRFIQQAVLQVLQTYIDQSFSGSSYGFRPKRSAIQAIKKGKEYVSEGYTIVVDIDLGKFFDRVNHDKLMSELFKRIKDKRVLKLIRGYLNAGSLEEGVFVEEGEGCPQGGPLSPILSNIMLDLLDKELEARGHKHVRYADDCNIYVKSRRSGERVMKTISEFIVRKLKLKVNEEKSKVDKVNKRKFLGFRLLAYKYKIKEGNKQEKESMEVSTVKIGISPESLAKFKARVREITMKSRGISTNSMIKQLSTYLRGWIGYYGISETPSVLRELDSWIRRRIRCHRLKQWKRGLRKKKGLMELGVPEWVAIQTANSSRGTWRLSHCSAMQIAMDTEYFEKIGLKPLLRKEMKSVN